ncbi:MAG: hypothetical protein ACI358_04670 [Candidatus Limimorpha sp.]
MNVKKVTLDHQLAISLLSDTVSIKDMLGMMDSTTNKWLMVRNDSIFVFYNTSIYNVLNGNDFMSSLGDVEFDTEAEFDVPSIPQLPVQSTVITETIDLPQFASFPFSYEGVAVSEIRLGGGTFSLDFSLNPPISAIKEINLMTDNIILGDGSPISISVDPSNSVSNCTFDLAGAVIAPDTDGNVAFSGFVIFEYDPSAGLDGGLCDFSLSGGLRNMDVDKLSAEISRPVDSLFNEVVCIDFGISGIDGHLFLPNPKIVFSYTNTFELGASCRIDDLYFLSGNGEVTDLLSSDNIEVSMLPTDGSVYHSQIMGLTEEIDALASYSKLAFAGEVAMNTVGGLATLERSDKIDIAADIELPFRLEVAGVSYSKAFDMDVDADIENDLPVEEIDLFFDFYNDIPLDLSFQAYLQKEDVVIDSLFSQMASIEYGLMNTIKVVADNELLNNILDADKMLVRFEVSTESISSDPVQFRESDFISLRLRMFAKITEIDLDKND